MKHYKVYKTMTYRYLTVVEASTAKEAEQIALSIPEKDMDQCGCFDEDVCARLVEGE